MKLNPWVESSILVRQRVIIAERYQWSQFQLNRAVWRLHMILNYRGVLPVDHEHGLLDPNSCYPVGHRWERFQTEALQLVVALRVDRAAVLVCRKVVSLTVNSNRLLNLRQK